MLIIFTFFQALYFPKDFIAISSGLISHRGKWGFLTFTISLPTVSLFALTNIYILTGSVFKGTCRHPSRGFMEKLSTRLKQRWSGAGGGPQEYKRSSILWQNPFHTLAKQWYLGHSDRLCVMNVIHYKLCKWTPAALKLSWSW